MSILEIAAIAGTLVGIGLLLTALSWASIRRPTGPKGHLLEACTRCNYQKLRGPYQLDRPDSPASFPRTARRHEDGTHWPMELIFVEEQSG